jgi:hypothetical protein
MAIIKKKAAQGATVKTKTKPMSKGLPPAGRQRPVDFEPKSKYPVTPNGGDNYDETIKREKELKKNGMMKMGGAMKKAKIGTSLGMKSVKAGYDDNSGVTRADFVSIGKGKAKMGKAVKKCKYGCK